MNHGVYFIESAGKIKIGYSSDIAKRFQQFKNGLPDYQPLAVWQGASKTDEWQLHNIFAAYRLNGEWFSKCDALERIIKYLTRTDNPLDTIGAITLHTRERYPGELESLRDALDKADLELEEAHAASQAPVSEHIPG